MSTATDWKRWYTQLKALEPDAYRKAIQYAEGVSLNYRLSDKAAAACEVSHVVLACELLGVSPPPQLRESPVASKPPAVSHE